MSESMGMIISRDLLAFFGWRRLKSFDAVSFPVPIQQRLEHLARVRAPHGCDFFRRAAGDHTAAMRAAFRSEIDDVVRALDDVEVVLDNDHRVAETDQPLQHIEQFVNVCEVKPGGWLIENVNRPARSPVSKVPSRV